MNGPRGTDSIPPKLAAIVHALANEFGSVDCACFGREATIYFRGSKGRLAMFTMEFACRNDEWYYVGDGPAIPLWDLLRKSGVDVNDIERFGT